MPEKDPTTWTAAQWALGYLMAMSGGLVNWYAKYKGANKKTFSTLELVGEVFTSGFVGMGVFMLFASFDQPMGVCAAGAGVGGHMATRLLSAIEGKVLSKFKDTETK